MKRIILVFFLLFFGGGAFFFTQNKSKNVRIAILTPMTHPSLAKIEKGFVETIKNNHPEGYTCTIFNAQGNNTLMRSELEEIILKKYDLVLTVGTFASQMTTEIFRRRNVHIPVVFTCVNDPVGFNIVASEKPSPDNRATGVKELVDLQTELSYLQTYHPTMKTLLLVYSPTHPGLKKDCRKLKELTQKMGIVLNVVEIFQTNELVIKSSPFIKKSDAVLVLKDNVVVAGLDALVKLCNNARIPLMASDLDSPDRGAAFGYGVYEIHFGIEAAKKALSILDDKIKPCELPTTPLTDFQLRINREAARKQGVSHDNLDH